MASYQKMAFVDSGSPKSEEALQLLRSRYEAFSIEGADVLVVLGGDGFLLETLHTYPDLEKPIFGMNRGTVGFLLNEFLVEGLLGTINDSRDIYLCPIQMEAIDIHGEKTCMQAFNEVSLLRFSGQSANLKIIIDETVALEKLSCDGVLVATPAGSTAYNLSAHGPVIPLSANLLALTPVSPFRPRRWKGTLLPNDVVITIENLDPVKRPVAAAADSNEVRDVASIRIWQDPKCRRHLLFDKRQTLEDRIIMEQFTV